MATKTRIKNLTSSTTNAPSILKTGEFGYSYQVGSQANGGDRLYIGTGTEVAGNAVNHEVIGGKYFTSKLDHALGTLTPNSAILVDANSKIDVLNVDNVTLNGNTISTTDTNGGLIKDLLPDGDGGFNFDAQEDFSLEITKDFVNDRIITVRDALDALKISLNMTKSDGTLDSLDYIAADFNRDGQVTVRDALDILKYSLGMEVSNAPEWQFVNASTDFSSLTEKIPHT